MRSSSKRSPDRLLSTATRRVGSPRLQGHLAVGLGDDALLGRHAEDVVHDLPLCSPALPALGDLLGQVAPVLW
ncbi:hypothetical protein CEB94_01125 [Streptomyces hawaiiensis]|uniref:Uncharacterized protein n=1 Tax=Streptomyces hawaiiensis TaxID=67305 RepID=A0A6G5R6Z9_9ACTN|nr:hypothetical protein CEB94_01125 [Streptomyces hawaiiensis]